MKCNAFPTTVFFKVKRFETIVFAFNINLIVFKLLSIIIALFETKPCIIIIQKNNSDQ